MVGYQPTPAPLERIAQALIANDSDHLVISVRQPDERLRAALAETRLRFVVALDDPHQAAGEFLDETGADPNLATRAIANSCAAVMRYTALPGALALRSEAARADPIGTVAALARHLGLSPGDAELARVATGIAKLWPSGSDGAERFPAAARKTMHAALAGYEESFAGKTLGQLAWNRELFAAADPDKRATDILDLSGGARIIVFGPYIHLPPGSWTARVYLGLSPEAAGHTLLIDAYAGAELAAASLQPASGGIYATDVNFALDEESCEHPVEIRVTVTQHDAKGQLAFGRVVLQVQAMRRPDTIAGLEEFASVLDL